MCLDKKNPRDFVQEISLISLALEDKAWNFNSILHYATNISNDITVELVDKCTGWAKKTGLFF